VKPKLVLTGKRWKRSVRGCLWIIKALSGDAMPKSLRYVPIGRWIYEYRECR
jgi:hypothetical protein